MNKIKDILSKYDTSDYKTFHDTIDMLCNKGIGNGCFQDMSVVVDILNILTACETMIKNGEVSNE